jgi:hypothetical protein
MLFLPHQTRESFIVIKRLTQREAAYFALQFGGSSPMAPLVWTQKGCVAGQNCFAHDQKAMMAEEEGAWSHSPLQGHVPNDLKPSRPCT